MPPPERPPHETSPAGQNRPAEAPAASTLSAAVAATARTLGAAGIEDAPAEARRLVAAAAAVPALDLLTRGESPLPPALAARISAFASRRAAHEPLSRILGEREFYGRAFALSPGTLDPRPDTETLVEVVLDHARSSAAAPHTGWPRTILDVGTGSAAILVTLLAELPGARGLGIDISADALATAAANADRHGVGARARFVHHDLRLGLPDAALALDGSPEHDLRTHPHAGAPAGAPATSWDLIVANPPYIPSADIAALAREVRCHDPLAALDGGADGLAFYRLLSGALARLAPGGMMAVEVGAGQADAVTSLLLQAGPGGMIRTALDLAGHVRVVAIVPRCHVVGEIHLESPQRPAKIQTGE